MPIYENWRLLQKHSISEQCVPYELSYALVLELWNVS
jgi:hypothetical protein